MSCGNIVDDDIKLIEGGIRIKKDGSKVLK